MQKETSFLLKMDDICMEFPGVRALNHAKLHIRQGETHALLGANGAGKSTLMKILTGIYSPTSGEIEIDGKKVKIKSPAHAQKLGVSIVFQELTVFPHLSVLENIFVNKEELAGGIVYKWKTMRKKAQQIIEELGVDLDINQKVQDLSVAQQQMVEIVRAVSSNAKLIVLDEPTSSLSNREVETLFEIMTKLRKKGVSLVYISHRLEEIYRMCDRITVLRDGQWIFTEDIQNVSREDLVSSMVGRKLEEEFPKRNVSMGEELLQVEGLTSQGVFQDISFTLHKGEVLGFAGLVGAGRTEIAKSIFGEFPYQKGRITLNGKQIRPKSSKDALKEGIAYSTEDRKGEGLLLVHSIRENASLSSLDKSKKWGMINRKKENQMVEQIADYLSIKAPNLEQKVVNLSGGNQQKVCLTKWLLTEPQVMILDEPTRGIDVGAKAEFYSIISTLAEQGVGVIVISSEEEELLGLCDRIIAMKEGKIQGQILPKEETQPHEKLVSLMFGMQSA